MTTLVEFLIVISACLLGWTTYTWIKYVRFMIYLRRNHVDKWNKVQMMSLRSVILYVCDLTIKETDEIQRFKLRMRLGLHYTSIFLWAWTIDCGLIALIVYSMTRG